MTGNLLVIGVGNRWRRDDGAGPAVAALVSGAGGRGVALDGEPARLVEAWSDEPEVVVVDASCTGGSPGTVRYFGAADLGEADHPRHGGHALGVSTAVGLGRAIGRLPGRLLVIAIEGADFGDGEGLTPAVARVVRQVAADLMSP
ncbi:MAG TPA: hydrogenase maturation protease [Acidimicrobiales bacterium]